MGATAPSPAATAQHAAAAMDAGTPPAACAHAGLASAADDGDDDEPSLYWRGLSTTVAEPAAAASDVADAAATAHGWRGSCGGWGGKCGIQQYAQYIRPGIFPSTACWDSAVQSAGSTTVVQQVGGCPEPGDALRW